MRNSANANRFKRGVLLSLLLAAGTAATACSEKASNPASTTLPGISAAVAATATPPHVKSFDDLIREYGDLPLADAHNHDASGSLYSSRVKLWQYDRVDRIVLFGDVSEPSAVHTDQTAMKAYREYPDMFIPFFSGIDLHDKNGLKAARENLEQGFFGIGEIAAASTYSPVVSKVAWKAKDPMDGILPDLYTLCAEYKVPILLHIDPPSGEPIAKLEEALDRYPDTTIIFGHGNVYNSPDNLLRLLEKHPNLYVDFFAGFTLFDKGSTNRLEDFLPVVRKFPDRIMLSTDSGFGLATEEMAVEAMYRFIDLLGDRELARKVAYDNLDRLIKDQPATKTQLEEIRKKDPNKDTKGLTKIEAGRIILGAGNAPAK